MICSKYNKYAIYIHTIISVISTSRPTHIGAIRKKTNKILQGWSLLSHPCSQGGIRVLVYCAVIIISNYFKEGLILSKGIDALLFCNKKIKQIKINYWMPRDIFA